MYLCCHLLISRINRKYLFVKRQRFGLLSQFFGDVSEVVGNRLCCFAARVTRSLDRAEQLLLGHVEGLWVRGETKAEHMPCSNLEGGAGYSLLELLNGPPDIFFPPKLEVVLTELPG